MTRIRLVLAPALALALLAPAPANASFPGKNGPLVVSLETCYKAPYLAKVPWRGGEPTSFTPVCEGGQESPQGFTAPEASPDGRTLLAMRYDSPPAGRQVVTMAADGTGVTPVPLPGGGSHFTLSVPSFAPNGRWFAFEEDRYENGVDQEPLWATRLDGTASRRIEEPRPCRGGNDHCAVYQDPRWSPDGRLIAVNVENALGGGLWLIRARDGKPVRRIGGSRAYDPDWSPDGRSIVFRTPWFPTSAGVNGGNLYVVSRDGKHRRRLVHRENIAESEPTWSPDGRWIAWVALKYYGGDEPEGVMPSLWRVRAGDGRLRKIGDLPEPYMEETFHVPPQLTWLPR